MFRIRPYEAKTLSWWFTQRDLIRFDPPYQRRGDIWNKNAQGYLIDSILNDFDIPKIYLADFSYVDSPLNETKSQYAVIDGRQRLEAIFGFYDGNVTLNEDFTSQDEPSVQLGGLGYKDLLHRAPKLASKFDNFNLSVMSVLTNDEALINELFVRLNSSKPLTAPEFRNAMKGVVPPLIRSLARHHFFRTDISFKTDRGEDQQVAAKFLLVEFRGDLVDTKRASLDRFVQDATRAEALTAEMARAGSRAKRVLDGLHRVFLPRDLLLQSPGSLVVYYWLVRTLGPAPDLRSFLFAFEAERKQNRERAKKMHTVDPELLHYDSLNRSVNDAGSLRGRFLILETSYSAWGIQLPLRRGPRAVATP
jgi:hypothetical protein